MNYLFGKRKSDFIISLRMAFIMLLLTSISFSDYAQPNCDNTLVSFKQNNLWGYKNEATGSVVISPQYDFADNLFVDGVSKVKSRNKFGLINCYGEEVVKCKYDDIIRNGETHSYVGKEGLVKVWLYLKYGLVSKSGNEIASCKYDFIGDFSDSIALVEIGENKGCINVLGQEVIPCTCSEININKLVPKLLVVSKDSKYGVFDKYGKEKVACKYDKITITKYGIHIMLDKKSGLISLDGKLIAPCEYDVVYDLYDSLALVKKDHKYGFLNESGEFIIPMIYDTLVWNEKKHTYFKGGKVCVKKDGKYGIIDKKGREIVPCIYDWEIQLPVFSKYAEVTSKGLKGIIDRTGKEILPCIYEEITWDYDPQKNLNIPVEFKNKELFNAQLQEKWGVVDDSGKIVIPFKYEELDCFVNGLAAASLDGKWGYINMHDSIAIPFIYSYCQSFDDKLAIAGYYEFEKNTNNVINKFGLINKKGKKILPFEYSISWLKTEYVYVFSTTDGKVGVADSNGKVFIEPLYNISPSWDSWKSNGIIKVFEKNIEIYGYYSRNGNLIIPFKYIDAGNFSEDMAVVRESFKWGYVNKKGKEVIPLKYDEAYSFSEGLALIRLNGKYGFIDKKGVEIIPTLYDAASSFADGFALVQENESTYGLIDKTGRIIIPAEQDNILFNTSENSYFTEELALVQKNGYFGYFNNQGTMVIPFSYNWADFFSYGRAVVKDSLDNYFFIDKNGNHSFQAKYSKAYSFHNGFALVKTEKTYQMIDTTGRVIKTFSYDEIKTFYDGPAAVRLGKLWGFIDEKGNEIIAPKYDKAASFNKGEAQVELYGDIFRINVSNEIVGQGVK